MSLIDREKLRAAFLESHAAADEPPIPFRLETILRLLEVQPAVAVVDCRYESGHTAECDAAHGEWLARQEEL